MSASEQIADKVVPKNGRWKEVTLLAILAPPVLGLAIMWLSVEVGRPRLGIVGIVAILVSVPWYDTVTRVAERKNLDECPKCGQPWEVSE